MITLEYNNATQLADLVRNGGNIQTSELMNTAVLISLFTRRRAAPDDVLPDPMSSDRQGWWADTYADVEGDILGSRLWLLRRSKTNQTTLNRAKIYAEEALQWFVDDGIAESVNADVEWHANGVLALRPMILQPAGPVGRWSGLWLAHLNQL